MRSYEIEAPAKLNLTLRVLDQRADGYHDIESWMVPISLYDRLKIGVGGDGIRLRVPGRPELESEDNLCVRAARAFERELEIGVGIDVVLEKRIPIAGGLGGGSSDAAAVLRCLAHHHRIDREDPRLAAAALSVGSDVPFFLRGEAAIARGRGERLSPAPALSAPLHVVVLEPPFGVSAREAYETLSKLRAEAPSPGEIAALPSLFSSPEAVGSRLLNDLEPAVDRLRPTRDCRERLLEAGVHTVLLAGSGACVFGLARSSDDATRAGRTIRARPNEVIHVAHTLQGAPELRETSR